MKLKIIDREIFANQNNKYAHQNYKPIINLSKKEYNDNDMNIENTFKNSNYFDYFGVKKKI